MDITSILTDGGSLGLLGLVLYMFNNHFTRMLDNHDEDRRTWLEALREVTAKLGLIEGDMSDIEEEIREVKTSIKKIEEKV